MTSNMAESQNIFEEDRISNLPGKVIEFIMEFMPVRDAARTCVLSNKWRYVWAKRPSLVLDMDFWDDIEWNRLPNKLEIDYANIVSSILLYHIGHIRKFVIDVSVLSCHIDLWLSSLFRRGLRELGLENSNNGNHYEVPCLVFSTSTLTHLSLSGCLIKAEDTAGYFTNIQSLILDDVILPSVALTIPLLTSLTLERCSGSRDFEVSAPRLASLTLDENDYLNLKPFLTCSGINYAYLFSTEYIEDYVSRRLSLVKLLAAWPRISQLIVDGLCFKYLATGSIPCTLEIDNLRYLSLCDLNLDLELIPWILCMLKNSPLLHTFEIWFAAAAANDWEEVNDIDEPRLADIRIDELPTVMMKDFTASRNEVMFTKILLHSTPALGRMLIEENDELDHEERINILKKLLVLQRAFPKPEIIFGPNLVPL